MLIFSSCPIFLSKGPGFCIVLRTIVYWRREFYTLCICAHSSEESRVRVRCWRYQLAFLPRSSSWYGTHHHGVLAPHACHGYPRNTPREEYYFLHVIEGEPGAQCPVSRRESVLWASILCPRAGWAHSIRRVNQELLRSVHIWGSGEAHALLRARRQVDGWTRGGQLQYNRVGTKNSSWR